MNAYNGATTVELYQLKLSSKINNSKKETLVHDWRLAIDPAFK